MIKRFFLAIAVFLFFHGSASADSTYVPSQAEEIATDTTNFGGTLSSADSDVQKALDTLDDAIAGAGSGDVTAVGSCATGNCLVDGANHTLTFEGGTNDTVESILGATDPTVGDQTFNLPDMAAGGTYTIATTASNVATATALAADPANCVTATHFVVGINAGGVPDCEAISDADVPDTITASNYQPLDADLTTWAGLTPSANAQSLVTAANYAAMRALLDLEAGTDFYSISGADAAFQPLEATLTDIADGTIAEDLVNTANPWADNEVLDTITASNYLPLSGGVLTGEATADDLGLEFTAGDALTDCSTFSATGGGIFYDDSEGKFKKCQDNTLTDLDTGGGTGAPTDADYLVGTANGSLSAEIVVGTSPGGELGGTWASPTLDDSITVTGWTLGTFSGTTGTVGTMNIDLLDGVGAVDMDYGSADITDHTFTTDGTGDAEIVLPNDSIGVNEIGDDAILETMLKAVDAASDEECLTYETTTGDFEWQSCGSGGGGAKIIQLNPYSGKLSGAYVTATITSVTTATQGAQIDAGDGNWRVLFDATTDEAVVFYGIVPDNYTSTPVVKLIYSMVSGTANEVEWEAAVMCVTPGDAADIGTASFAAGAASVETVPGTAGHTDTLVSITPTDDSCAAGDIIYVWVSTDAADATNDDATGDRELVGAYVAYS